MAEAQSVRWNRNGCTSVSLLTYAVRKIKFRVSGGRG
jgi:hypothetical protein